MQISFTKIAVCGKEYLCLPDTSEDPARLARRLGHPDSGITADGILLLSCRDGEAPALTCFTPAGHQIPAPRSALAAGAKYLYDRALVNLTELCLTASGTSYRLRLETRGGAAWGATIDEGFPHLDASRYSAHFTGLVREERFSIGDDIYRLTIVGIAGAPVALLAGDTIPSRKGIASLTPLFATEIQVLYLLPMLPQHRILLRAENSEYDILAAAVCVAAAISGRADFNVSHALSCGREHLRVSVSPILRISVTWEVKECFSGTMETE